jgi:hypothetical protein
MPRACAPVSCVREDATAYEPDAERAKGRYDASMQCNIDARGKRLRLINGIVTVAVGLVLLFTWALPAAAGWLPWAVTVGVLASGAFMIWQARAGWCVVRAMGFKTPI